MPSAGATHAALNFYQALVPYISIDPAGTDSITAVTNLTGEGGGSWTVHAANGTCSCVEGAAADADVTMTQSVDTFAKLLVGLTSPEDAMASGDLTIDGMDAMPRYGAIFPGVDPSRPIPPLGPTSLG